MAQQVQGPAAVGRGRARGASMALMPDRAAGDCLGPAPLKRQKRRETSAPRLAAVPEQRATPGAMAVPEQLAPALDVIREADTEEGGDPPGPQLQVAATENAAPAAPGRLSHGMQGQASAKDQAADVAAAGRATKGEAPAFSDGPLQPCSQHQCNGGSAARDRPEGASTGKQNREPVRRSMRRCTMAAQPSSAFQQAGRPGSALSPVLEHSQAPSGACLLKPIHVMQGCPTLTGELMGWA